MLDIETERYLCAIAILWFFSGLTIAAMLNLAWQKVQEVLNNDLRARKERLTA